MEHNFEMRRRAYNLYLEGKGYKSAAKQLGLNVSTVRDWFRRFKVGAFDTLLSSENKTRRYPQEEIDRVIRLREEGCSWTAILEQTRIPIGTMKNWYRRYQLSK